MSRSKYSDRELIEGKTWQAVLYPDSESYNCEDILQNRLQNICETYYYIIHDRDKYTELDYEKYKQQNFEEPTFNIGDCKKKHIHVVIRKSCNCTLGMAAKQIGIESRNVDRCKSFKASVQYLIHKNNPEKVQYGIDELITNDDNINTLLRNDTMTDKARKLLDFIYSTECNSLYSISKFAINNDCWDELRRGQHIYTKLYYERLENER